MDPTLNAFLTAWDFRPEIAAFQVLLAAIYLNGWWTLRGKGSSLANGWRLAAYGGAHSFFVLALMSGIDTFQELLFFIHMTQHLLLVMIVPPLIWLAAPMPIGFWGLPRPWRKALGRLFSRHSPVRKALVEVSAPGVIWLAFTSVLWLWHDPNAYDAAIQNDLLHDLEHITFFGTGLLLWWHIVDAAPRIHKRRSYGVRLAIIALTYFQTIILGIGITMWGEVIYQHYTQVPRMWGIAPLTDQTYGGLIMWLPGGMMYLVAVLVLIGLMIKEDERKARLKTRINTRQALASRPGKQAHG